MSLSVQMRRPTVIVNDDAGIINRGLQLLSDYGSATLTPYNFGAVGDGVADDTAPVQAWLNYLGEVLASGQLLFDLTRSGGQNLRGNFRLTAPVYHRNAVSLDLGGACRFSVDHAGDGIIIGPLAPSVEIWSNIRIAGFDVTPLQNARDAIVVRRCSRGCGADKVNVLRNASFQFRDHFRFENTWTWVNNECVSFGPSQHHITATDDCGEIVMHYGRYDAAGDFGVYSDSVAGEITIVGAAIQFGTKAAVKTVTGYSVTIRDAFLEGNCIGNPSEYYVDVAGGGGTLSSVIIENVVFNDLQDANRTGAGVVMVAGYRDFKYRPRWSRNAASQVPVVGAGVHSVDVALSTSQSRAPLAANIGPTLDNYLALIQRNRPAAFLGMDMNGGPSVALTTRAAANFGLDTIGVAAGTFDSVGALQAYGASFALKLNPHNGTINLGQAGATVPIGTNSFAGTTRQIAQVTSSNITPAATTGFIAVDCTAGNRTVNMASIPTVAGHLVYIAKRDGSANTLTITPPSGTINGAGTLVLSSAYETAILICDGTNWLRL